MSPKLLSVLLTLAVFCTRHVPVMGVSIPAWPLILAVLAVLVLASAALLARTAGGFRSSPRPRNVIPQKERAA